MDGTETTVVLQNLSPLTKYLISVYSTFEEESSEPLKGTETTRMSSLFQVFNLLVDLNHFVGRNPLSISNYGKNYQWECKLPAELNLLLMFSLTEIFSLRKHR